MATLEEIKQLLTESMASMQRHQTEQFQLMEQKLSATFQQQLEKRLAESRLETRNAIELIQKDIESLKASASLSASTSSKSWADITMEENQTDESDNAHAPPPKLPRTVRSHSARTVRFREPASAPQRAASATRDTAMQQPLITTVTLLAMDDLMDKSERWALTNEVLNTFYDNNVPPNVRPIVRGTMSKVLHIGFHDHEAASTFVKEIADHLALLVEGASQPLRARMDRPPRDPELAKATNRVVAILHSYAEDGKITEKVRSDINNGALYIGRQHIGSVQVGPQKRPVFVPNAVSIRKVNLNVEELRADIRSLFSE